MAACFLEKDRIQKVKWGALAGLLLACWPLEARGRFDPFSRDLKHAAEQLDISDLRAEIRESGRVVWKRGSIQAAACGEAAATQEVAGLRIRWWFQPNCLMIEVPSKRLGLIASSHSTSLTEAPRFEDGNILRSTIALAFLRDVVGLRGLDRDDAIDQAFVAFFFGNRVGDRGAATTLARYALNTFPELESAPDVTLLYLFSQLGLPETESSATAVIKAHPDLPTAWFYYGQYLENQKRFREAAICFEKITMHEPPWHNWTVAAAKKELTYLKTN